MKKFLIGTMIIALASLGYSQGANHTMDEVRLSDVTITPINIDYIEKVREGILSERVITLEKKASRYNIKESPFFNIHSKVFEIRFKHRNGRINAVYNRNGKIVSAYEWHKNLKLPPAVRNAVFRIHPDWQMYRNAYLVSYRHRKGAKKLLKIQIRKDGLTKSLKFDIDGNRI